MTAAEQEWEPGDPLYHRVSTYQGYFYNFRPLGDEEEDCFCPDRASWPEPAFSSHSLKSEEWFIQKFREQAGINNG